MQIVTLDSQHEAALADFLDDFASAGEQDIPAWFAPADWPMERVVRSLDGWSRGELLPDGWRPCTTLFLEHDGALLGVVNLRHDLDSNLLEFGGHVGFSVRPSRRREGHATRLLGAALERARALGIDRALVTCAPDNAGSIGAVRRHGGVLWDERHLDRVERRVRRYWIDLRTEKGR